MQYILTKEEYRKLVPESLLDKEMKKVEKLNDKVIELSGFVCGSGVHNRSFTSYFDDCPLSAFGTDTCRKSKQYSK